jgi:hypothetical protein
MALTYNPAKIALSEGELFIHDPEVGGLRLRWQPNALVHFTMRVGLNEITTGNIPEWERRTAMLRAVGEPAPASYQGAPWWPTAEDLARYAGLKTNASVRTSREFNSLVAEYIGRHGLPK